MILRHITEKLQRLFRANASPKVEGAADLSAMLEKKVLALVENMPTLPDTATRILAMIDDPASKFTNLANLIEQDAALAKAVLQMANSALYACGTPAVRLEQAVSRLGLWECKHLVISIGVRSLFRRMELDAKCQCESLWHHGALTAYLCRQFSRTYRIGLDGQEYSAGLLHDLGRTLLVLAGPGCFARAGGLDYLEEPGLLERERTAIGIDHAALGSWFGEHSKLPDALIQTMRFHHEPALALSNPTGRLIALVAAADHAANHLQSGLAMTTYSPEKNAGLTCLMSGWSQPKREQLLNDLPKLMQDAHLAIGTGCD
jgi:HD-like signal output (HDOD) protein